MEDILGNKLQRVRKRENKYGRIHAYTLTDMHIV